MTVSVAVVKHWVHPQNIEPASHEMREAGSFSVFRNLLFKLLILDEATSGLDPVMRDEMLDVFLEFVEDETHSILLSSHITSDLEKIADYITFIHNGKIIMTALKDDLIYNYAIIRCKESQFEKIDRADIVAYRRKEHQIDVLVSGIKTANRKYDGYVVDRTSIDEIMLLLVKGETK